MAEIALALNAPAAPDRRVTYRRFLRIALMIALLAHMLGIGTYWLIVELLREEEPTAMVRILKYSELGPPPSIGDNAPAPSLAVAAPAARPTIGVPIPVPDDEALPDQTIATQTELSSIGSPAGDGFGSGTQIGNDLKIDESTQEQLKLDDGPPADFVPYEKEPSIVHQVQPKYPELAQRAGLEGTVILKVWVDKEGKVRKAVVLKSDGDVFNQAAIDAAMQWSFTPALQQKRPIDVWVAIPFRFQLRDAAR